MGEMSHFLLNQIVYNYGTYVDTKLQERTKNHKPKYSYKQILNERSSYETMHGVNATGMSLRKFKGWLNRGSK